MPSPHELAAMHDKTARTQVQKRDDRRFDAALTFETMPEKEYQARNLNPSQFSASPKARP